MSSNSKSVAFSRAIADTLAKTYKENCSLTHIKALSTKDTSDSFRIAVLASGSKGNATYIEIDGVRILIDVGISTHRLTRTLAALGISIAELDGIFITHEHSDHIRGLATLLKRYHLPLFAPSATLRAIRESIAVPDDTFTPLKKNLTLGAVTIESFPTLHDAISPVGYTVCGSKTFALATDLGFLTNTVFRAIDKKDVLLLEANHDRELLQRGSYPKHLKQRILSNRGHLENSAAAWALVRLKKRPQAVFLAHMSQENNSPTLVKSTVETILRRQNIRQENILLAAQDTPTLWGFAADAKNIFS